MRPSTGPLPCHRTSHNSSQSPPCRRAEGRDHAQHALRAASSIRDGVERQRTESRDYRRFGRAARFDDLPVQKLRDAGILIPDERVRNAIHDALNLVTAASVLADEEGWEQTPSGIQMSAMIRLRLIIGAYLRRDSLPAEDLKWMTSKANTLERAWKDLDELSMSRRIDE